MVTISGEWTVGDIIVLALIVAFILALGYIFGNKTARRRMQNQQATPNNNSKPGLLFRLCGCCRGEGNSGDGGDFGANTDTVAQGDNGGFSLGVGDGSAGGTTGGTTGGGDGGAGGTMGGTTGGCDGGGGGGGGTGVSTS